jgi:hypothetical protein
MATISLARKDAKNGNKSDEGYGNDGYGKKKLFHN